MELTTRFQDALQYTAQLHKNQLRKGSGVPYLAHLLSVTALVLEDGGDEDQAIAALLHDAVEDQGGLKTLEEIRRRYGDRVASIVDGCTDSYTTPKLPWRERKESYLERLRQADSDIRRVSLADKLHNAYSLLKDLRVHGSTTWHRFKGGKTGTLWYFNNLLYIFRESGNSPMIEEFSSVISDIEKAVEKERTAPEEV